MHLVFSNVVITKQVHRPSLYLYVKDANKRVYGDHLQPLTKLWKNVGVSERGKQMMC
jgi:hypothetical protein